jgi:hypothetical protein
MRPGAIVLTVIPQDNQQKKRPVLVLEILPKYNDFLVRNLFTASSVYS